MEGFPGEASWKQPTLGSVGQESEGMPSQCQQQWSVQRRSLEIMF